MNITFISNIFMIFGLSVFIGGMYNLMKTKCKNKSIYIGLIIMLISTFSLFIIKNTDTYKNYEFNKQVEIYNQVENATFKNGNWFVQFVDQDDLVVYTENEIPDEVLEQITLQ